MEQNKDCFLVQCMECGCKTAQIIYTNDEKGILLKCLMCDNKCQQYHRMSFLKHKQIPITKLQENNNG